MRAAAYDEHGKASVLTLRNDYPKPTILPDQVLVQIHYAAINPWSVRMLRDANIYKHTHPTQHNTWRDTTITTHTHTYTAINQNLDLSPTHTSHTNT